MKLEPDPNCELCRGNCFVEDDEGALRGCVCLRQGIADTGCADARSLVLPGGVRLRAGEYGLDDLRRALAGSDGEGREYRRAVETAREWADGIWTNLLLVGPPGTGKTTLAVAALMEMRQRGCRVRRWREIEECRLLLSDSWRDRQEAEDNLSWVSDPFVQAVLIDELGAGAPSSSGKSGKGCDAYQAALYHLVDTSYERRRPVAATTNLGKGQLERVLGPRTWSRLSEGVAVVAMTEINFRTGRQKKAAARP